MLKKEEIISKKTGSLRDLFEKMINTFSDEQLEKLPVDGAEQHDHYIYGLPKRKQ